MSKKLVLVLAVALLALMAVPGVFAADTGKYPYGPPPWTIGMSQDTMDQPWRAYMVTSAVTESKKYPNLIKEFIFTDGKGTNEKQIADIEDLIARKVNLIIMSPREAQGLVRPCRPSRRRGSPSSSWTARSWARTTTCSSAATI